MLPLLIIVVASLMATTTVVWWDDLLIRWKGKRLAVLGARAVGKTHLVSFLTTGSLPEEYTQTLSSQKTVAHRFELDALQLYIRRGEDVSGSADAYGEWKRLLKNSDVVLYLLRADRLIAGDPDVEIRVRDDLGHISEWLEPMTPRPTFLIVGTHCDLDPAYLLRTKETAGDYADRFGQLPFVKDLVLRAGGLTNVKILLGSLGTLAETQRLVAQVLKELAR